MKEKRIKDLKNGDCFFLPKAIKESFLLVRGSYNHRMKSYACHYYYDRDIGGFLKGDTIVIVEITI